MEHTRKVWHRKGHELDGTHGPRAGRGRDKKNLRMKWTACKKGSMVLMIVSKKLSNEIGAVGMQPARTSQKTSRNWHLQMHQGAQCSWNTNKYCPFGTLKIIWPHEKLALAFTNNETELVNLESGRSVLVVFLKYIKRWWCNSYQRCEPLFSFVHIYICSGNFDLSK